MDTFSWLTNGPASRVFASRDKHGDLRWCAVEALPAETIPYVRQALIAMSRGERYSEFGWLLNPPG